MCQRTYRRKIKERKRDIETYFKKSSNIYREALLELAEDPDNINTNLKQKFVRELAHIDHDDKYKKAAESFEFKEDRLMQCFVV